MRAFFLLIFGLSACGGGADRVSIRGDFADSASAAALVRAVEAEREAEVKGGAFELRGLSAGPATLRLVHGADTAVTLALDNAPGAPAWCSTASAPTRGAAGPSPARWSSPAWTCCW